MKKISIILLTLICSTFLLAQTSSHNGHEFVDLGLSVKWATMNVGATTPEDFGYYYASGEISPKAIYNWSTYKYCNGSDSTITKYCSSKSNRIVDNKRTLEPDDDVAHVNWGGSFRIPTRTEWQELLKECTWKWTTQNGVKGYKVTSRKEGYTDKSIFLPAAGYRIEGRLSRVGTEGKYCSSTFVLRARDVCVLSFTDEPYVHCGICYSRELGRSVRPVLP